MNTEMREELLKKLHDKRLRGDLLKQFHKTELWGYIKKYLESVDKVFGLINKAIKNNNVYKLLKGPVAHSGFKRLT